VSIVDDLLADAEPLVIEEAPKLLALGELIAKILSGKQAGDPVGQAAVDTADVAADVAEDAKFGPKQP
jgi:hypothetical protein